MYLVCRGNYENGLYNIKLGEAWNWRFGDEDYTRSYTAFWGTLTTLGVIFFIIGIPIALIGAVIREKNIPFTQHPQPYGNYYQQPKQQPLRYCPNCDRSISMDAQLCPYCEKDFRPPITTKSHGKYMYCTECGTKLPPKAKYCTECGKKIDRFEVLYI